MPAEACPRAGFVGLWDGIRLYHMPTTCKTWGCSFCNPKLLALARMKIQFACLTLPRCWLTTVTYVNTGVPSTRDASSVAKDWARFLKAFKFLHPNLSWIKVPELTKMLEPHLHLIIGGVTTSTRICRDPKKFTAAWAIADCLCLRHQVSRTWYNITGAYVADVQPVWNAHGIGNYMAKYFTKGFMAREAMEQKGFKRRYSSSRNWPKPRRLQTQGTADGAWLATRLYDKRHMDVAYLNDRCKVDRKANRLRPVGDDLALHLSSIQTKAALTAKFENWRKSFHGLATV